MIPTPVGAAHSPMGTGLPDPSFHGSRIEIETDIAYSGLPHQRLDIHRPVHVAPKATVVCFFGGAFVMGDKRDMARPAAVLAAAGFAVATPGYALADPRSNRRAWPQVIHDAKAAIRFVRGNADRLGLAREPVFAMGHSSGAWLALMAGLTGDNPEFEGGDGGVSSAVAGVVNISGVADRRSSLGTATEALLGKGYESDAALRTAASPIAHLKPGAPPIFTLQGSADPVVSSQSASLLEAACRAAGVEHRLRMEFGQGHNPVTPSSLCGIIEWLDEIVARHRSRP